MIIGIDIGGTKMRGVLMNLFAQAGGKKVQRFYELDTPKNKKDFEKRIRALIWALSTKAEVDKFGISIAGQVLGTTVKYCPNIKYLKNYNFKSLKLGKIKVINDARAFLIAEASNKKDVMGITIGTGIGRASTNNASKHLEQPETWEKEYQRLRDKKDEVVLGNFLVGKLNLLLKKYKAKTVILCGGVIHRKKLFEILKKDLEVKIIKAKLLPRSGAIGAAMLWR